jgi:2-methylcitrate dehydratase
VSADPARPGAPGRRTGARGEDRLLDQLTDYALNPRLTVADDVGREVRHRLLDVLGCALAGADDASTRAVLAYVREHDQPGVVAVWGTERRVGPAAAAFINGTAVRCLDFNDGFQGRHGDGGHPSDVIPALVAVAEHVDACMDDLIAAVAVAYEVAVSFMDALAVRRQGFDHVSTQAIGIVCGAGRLLGLDGDRLASAIAMVAVSAPALWQTRKDPITMWKSIAAAHAASHAIEACLLAKAGVVGPGRPLEGVAGYLAVLGGPSGLDPDGMASVVAAAPPRKILDTNLKLWPIGQYAQSAVDAALEIHATVQSSTSPIAELVIETFEQAVVSMSRPANWDPPNRESADHSLPYSVVVAALYGSLTSEMFDDDMRADPEVRRLLESCVRVEATAEFEAVFPHSQPCRIRVRFADGDVAEAERFDYRGHVRNPAERADHVQKFRTLAAAHLTTPPDEIADLVLDHEGSAHVRVLIDALAQTWRTNGRTSNDR